MNVAEYIVKKLEELGITEFFGVPDCYNFNILYAIKNNSNTNWIGCTNELNAGYAADGYAREKGYGAVITTYGTGELSVINAIAGSYAENVPVINIVGVPKSNDLKNTRNIHNSFGSKNKTFTETYKTVTQTTAFLDANNAKVEIDRVIRVFVKEKKPVYLAIPEDVALTEIENRDVDYGWLSDNDNLNLVADKIYEKIINSSKPLIMADSLISRFDSIYEFKQFVEKSNLPVMNLIMGIGIIGCEYKNYLGRYLNKEDNSVANKYMNETDCLISVGCIYNDYNTDGNVIPFDINSHVAIYGTYTYINNKKFENVKMADVLEALSEKLQTVVCNEIFCSKIGYEIVMEKKEKISSDYIYPRIQEFLKENDIIIADCGTAIQGLAKIKFPPNIKFYVQSIWRTIGWATPAALGLCFAKPDSRVILLTGDGAHQATALEIAGILRYGFKPVIIVINNNGYTAERLLCSDINEDFNNVAKINYSKFCRALGSDVWSVNVETDDGFDKALKVTQIMDKLCYIEICTDVADVVEAAKRFALKIKNNKLNIDVESHANLSLKNEAKKTVHYSGFEYETTVHESLRLDETEEL